jgi:flagellar protein FlbD
VILVHRLRGEPMFLNDDLIESIEATPDTVVTLVDGKKLILADTPEELVERARLHRASILAAVEEMRTAARGEVVPFPVVSWEDGGED